MTQRLIGFFKHNPFPYVVAFEIERFDEKGNARVKGVGMFTAAQLITVRPLAAGKALEEVIGAIDREYQKSCRNLHNDFVDKVEDVLGVKLK